MTNSTARRSGRIPREIPILLIGSDAEGTVFSEETKTVMISLHGAGIVSTHALVSEQELNLRLLESNRETEIRVAGEIGSQNRLHAYGVAFVDPTLDFWQIPFPPAPANEPVQPPISLACTSCDANISLQYGDFEADVALFTAAWCAIAAIVDSPPCGSAAPSYPPEAPRQSPSPSLLALQQQSLFSTNRLSSRLSNHSQNCP
jgi:PilZ domain